MESASLKHAAFVNSKSCFPAVKNDVNNISALATEFYVSIHMWLREEQIRRKGYVVTMGNDEHHRVAVFL